MSNSCEFSSVETLFFIFGCLFVRFINLGLYDREVFDRVLLPSGS